MPELSILLPSIRPYNLSNLYDSILKSTNRKFEVIVVGPGPLPDSLCDKDNVRFCRDFGNPARALQIAFTMSCGDIVHFGADDAVYLPGVIDRCIDALCEMGDSNKNCVTAKYLEGVNGTQKTYQPDFYYRINNGGGCSSPFIPDSYLIFNVMFAHRNYLEMLGGFDSRFITTAISSLDLAVRAQFDNCRVKLLQDIVLDTDWYCNDSFDHGPIHRTQGSEAEPLFRSIYRDHDWRSKIKVKIDIDSWKQSEPIWRARFNE